MDDIEIIDNVSADSLEVGDQAIIEGDHVEINSIMPTDDLDEIVVKGYSHDTGDSVEYSLYADDYYDIWAV